MDIFQSVQMEKLFKTEQSDDKNVITMKIIKLVKHSLKHIPIRPSTGIRAYY